MIAINIFSQGQQGDVIFCLLMVFFITTLILCSRRMRTEEHLICDIKIQFILLAITFAMYYFYATIIAAFTDCKRTSHLPFINFQLFRLFIPPSYLQALLIKMEGFAGPNLSIDQLKKCFHMCKIFKTNCKKWRCQTIFKMSRND